jgi:hypothetical protein
MSDDTSARFSLPLLRAGQAQKEMSHNEALTVLDLLVQGSVVAAGVNTPPADPAPGECWIVGAAPTGAWNGQAGVLAGWTGGGWRFVAAVEGMALWSAGDRAFALYSAGDWLVGEIRGTKLVVDGDTVVRARQPAIADPAGGSVADAESRTAVIAILTALRTHGLIES